MKIKVRQLYMQHNHPARYEIYDTKGKIAYVYYPDVVTHNFDVMIEAILSASHRSRTI